MRLCFVTQSVSRTGYGLHTALRGTTVALREAGCDVSVAGLWDRHADADRALWNGVPVHAFKHMPPAALGYAPEFRPWLDAQDPFDVVSLHGVWEVMNANAAAYARARRARILLTPQGMLDSWALRRSSWKKRLARTFYADGVLRNADCFHVFSRAEAEAVRQLGLHGPIAVIPNGVELPSLIERAVPATELRNLLFLGRLHEKKGIAELVQAWGQVAAGELRSWRLLIAGPDEQGQRRALGRMAAGVPRLEFVGEVHGQAKNALWRKADAFILPSRSEGFPMAVLEAWSYGLPVLMTDACNIPEGFAAGAALSIAPTTESIVTGLRALAGHSRRELREMGARGRNLVEQDYSWSRVAKDLQEVYAWLCASGRRPDLVIA